MFLFRLNKFLTYKMFSRHKRGHGIHSPFLYDLIRSVFRNKTEAHVVLMVERIRKRNRNDKSRIKIEDLGSGSLSMGSKTRRVSISQNILRCKSMGFFYRIWQWHLVRKQYWNWGLLWG